MLLEHLRVVHLVNVVAGKNKDELRAFAANRINILVHRVRGPLIPLFRNAHLRRQNFDIFAETGQSGPTGADVPAQTECFVLCKNENAAQPGVDAVGQGNVDDSVERAKRNCGFCAIARQRPQSLTLASCQQHHNGITHVLHGWLSCGGASSYGRAILAALGPNSRRPGMYARKANVRPRYWEGM